MFDGHSLPSSTEIENVWGFTSIPPLHVCTGEGLHVLVCYFTECSVTSLWLSSQFAPVKSKGSFLTCYHESLPLRTSSQSYFLFFKIHCKIILIPVSHFSKWSSLLFPALYVVTCGLYKIKYINLFDRICNHFFIDTFYYLVVILELLVVYFDLNRCRDKKI
jgi:hypothetical protein